MAATPLLSVSLYQLALPTTPSDTFVNIIRRPTRRRAQCTCS